MTKVVVLYTSSFWRDRGLNGEALCTQGPICYVVDMTNMYQPGLVCFVSGDAAKAWAQKSKEAREQDILSQLAVLFGDEARTPFSYTEKIWADEPYVGGCPVAVSPVCGVLSHLEDLRSATGRVHWAGTETATVWYGYMDGAVQSAVRAAHEVAAELCPQKRPGLEARLEVQRQANFSVRFV